MKKQKACKSVLKIGPGHQSNANCERLGPHVQHRDSNMGYYWTKQKFSGHSDESPEDWIGDPAPPKKVAGKARGAK